MSQVLPARTYQMVRAGNQSQKTRNLRFHCFPRIHDLRTKSEISNKSGLSFACIPAGRYGPYNYFTPGAGLYGVFNINIFKEPIILIQLINPFY